MLLFLQGKVSILLALIELHLIVVIFIFKFITRFKIPNFLIEKKEHLHDSFRQIYIIHQRRIRYIMQKISVVQKVLNAELELLKNTKYRINHNVLTKL